MQSVLQGKASCAIQSLLCDALQWMEHDTETHLRAILSQKDMVLPGGGGGGP